MPETKLNALQPRLNIRLILLLCWALLLAWAPQTAVAEGAAEALTGCDFAVTGDADNYSWDESTGVLTITGGDVEVSNKDASTATSQRIYIKGVAHVTLGGVNITTSTGAPIEIRDYSDTNVTLTLKGSNTLVSQTGNKAGIHKTRGQQADSSKASTLTIDGSGSLTATGGSNAAGIGGGGWRGDVHNITIDGGTINATGTSHAAGIGSSDDGSTWNIVINGGDVTANGNPGIGADNYNGVKFANITGGAVVASSYTGSTPTGGLVSTDSGKSYTLRGDYTLTKDLNIADDGTFTVAEGAKLTVAEGVTLTNQGTLVNNGAIAGKVVNDGTAYNKGTLPSDMSGTGTVYEQHVIVNGGTGTGNYAEGSTVTITADDPAEGKMFTGWTVELGSVELADSSKSQTTFTMPDGCAILTAGYADIMASVTDADEGVTYYSDSYEAQRAWRESGGTLTVYSDKFSLNGMSIPNDGVLDLNGHSITAMELMLDGSITIKNGTLMPEMHFSIYSGAQVTFENVVITNSERGHWPVEIYNNGTIINKGLALDEGITISGSGTVTGDDIKTALTDSKVSLDGVPEDGYVFDGSSHVPSVKYKDTTLTEGTDYTVSLSNSSGGSSSVNAGTVTMTITGTGNYLGTVIKTYTIAAIDPGIGAVSADVLKDSLDVSDVVLNRENTSVPGKLAVDAGQTLVYGEKNAVTYSFVPTSSNYKTVTGTVTVTVKDTAAPVATVSMGGKTWKSFVDDTAFDLFFNKSQTVGVTAEDNLSGVAKIEYFESGVAMDLEAVKAAAGWTPMPEDGIEVAAEDGKQFVFYIRVTDNAGNVAYLSTEGAEFDTTAPVISGVDDGATYSATQKVTVTDKNIESVTLNGKAVGTSFTLDASKEASCTIVATDKAGNSTTVTVKMEPTGSTDGGDKADPDGSSKKGDKTPSKTNGKGKGSDIPETGDGNSPWLQLAFAAGGAVILALAVLKRLASNRLG